MPSGENDFEGAGLGAGGAKASNATQTSRRLADLEASMAKMIERGCVSRPQAANSHASAAFLMVAGRHHTGSDPGLAGS